MTKVNSTHQRLGEILSSIEEPMERVDQWLDSQFQGEHPTLGPLLEHAARFRGKRVRAAQVLLLGQIFGEINDDHIVVAGILEMIHAATLIHDDVLDEAEERRGLDCVHVEWGRHASVLLGDWIYARAFLRSTELSDQICSQVLAAATANVCRGEIHQNLSRGNFNLSYDDYIGQIDGKTAALYAAAGRLGAHYAGQSTEVQQACELHGLYSGRAFQMIDDVLDLEGDQKKVGKSLGTDWARGKMTLPLIQLRNGLIDTEQNELAEAFGSGQDRHVLFNSKFSDRLKIHLEGSKSQAMDLLQLAANSLDCLPDSAARQALQELTMFLGTRKN